MKSYKELRKEAIIKSPPKLIQTEKPSEVKISRDKKTKKR